MALTCSLQLASLNVYNLSTRISVGGGDGHGMVWSYTNPSPTIINSDGATFGVGGSGVYNNNATVSCGHAHTYVRGYGTLGSIYVYSVTADVGATPICAVIPTVTTTTPTSITITGATGGGNVTSAGYPASVTDRGCCWSTSANPTTANAHTHNGSGTGIFTSSITGLLQNTLYHVRAYAINSTGTAYGADIQFTTLSQPILTTTAISNITETTASGGGNITSQGSSAVTARGVCWNTSVLPTTGNSHTHNGSGTGIFTSSIIGISQNNTYYVRAYAVNTQGIAYGNQETFSIPITPPRLTGGTDVHLFPSIGWSGKTQITTWAGATHQRWYSKLSTAPAYTLVKTLGKTTGNTTNYLVLTPNLNYSFYSTFYSITAESLPSNVIIINNTVSLPTATYSSIIIV